MQETKDSKRDLGKRPEALQSGKRGDKFLLAPIDKEAQPDLYKLCGTIFDRYYKAGYKNIVEQMPVVIYAAALDEISSTIYVSPRIKDILGLTQRQFMGSNDLWIKHLHPEERERVMAELEKTRREGVPFRCEYRMLTSNKEIVWVRDEASIIKDEQGRELFLQGVLFDITALKRAEKILLETERRLREGRARLETRVKQRTGELEKLNKQLRSEISTRKQAQSKLLVYQDRLRSLASELSLAEERTRRQIANDVHDHIGQNLALIKMKMQSFAEVAKNEEQQRRIGDIMEMISQTIERTRTLTFEISPPVLYELGFEAAVEWLLRKARKQHGLVTNFVTDGRNKPLDENVRVFLFQAVRELLANVVKHAKAQSVTVLVSRLKEHIQVGVADDGTGFDEKKIESAKKAGGFGLFSIRERLSYIGGKLNIESQINEGAKVTIIAPLAFNDNFRNKGKNDYENTPG